MTHLAALSHHPPSLAAMPATITTLPSRHRTHYFYTSLAPLNHDARNDIWHVSLPSLYFNVTLHDALGGTQPPSTLTNPHARHHHDPTFQTPHTLLLYIIRIVKS